MNPRSTDYEADALITTPQITSFSNNKMVPSQFLCFHCIFAEAVRQNYVTAHATNHEVDTTIKMWLKFASDRSGGRCNIILFLNRALSLENQKFELWASLG